MHSKLKKVEELYESLYELSKQIGELLDRKLYSDLVLYLAKKDKFLKEASSIIDSLQSLEELDTTKLKDLAQKYADKERENIQVMMSIKDEIKQELSKTNKDKKLLNAYNMVDNSPKGNILDFWE